VIEETKNTPERDSIRMDTIARNLGELAINVGGAYLYQHGLPPSLARPVNAKAVATKVAGDSIQAVNRVFDLSRNLVINRRSQSSGSSSETG